MPNSIDQEGHHSPLAADDKDAASAVAPPPKSLLLYLVRMGSFTSAPKISNGDTQDNDVKGVTNASVAEVLKWCRDCLKDRPPLLRRSFLHLHPSHNDFESPPKIRIMQWNILAQSLGKQNDNFVACPDAALDWNTRRFRILEEMLQYQPDVLCLQEVDHFNFFSKMLGNLGYHGIFYPKPDSPCIYINGNNGPDGCAIFYKTDKFDVLKVEYRVIEVWHVQSNQVAILIILRFKSTGQQICILTTHLKARQGPFLATLRNEQGKDILEFVKNHYNNCPLIICGDFNAEPNEPIYTTLLHSEFNLGSSYTALNNQSKEPPYTTWKIREEGETCHTIDYIFYSLNYFKVCSLLHFPNEHEIGAGRCPSLQYPSDHFSLVCDFILNNNRTLYDESSMLDSKY